MPSAFFSVSIRGLPVVEGAILKCDMGSATSKLSLIECRVQEISGRSVCRVTDHQPLVNILPFGTCAMRSGPCVPSTPSPWNNSCEPHCKISSSILVDQATLECTFYGTISVQDAGQSTVALAGAPVTPEIDRRIEPIDQTTYSGTHGDIGGNICSAAALTNALRALGHQPILDDIADGMVEARLLHPQDGATSGLSVSEYVQRQTDDYDVIAEAASRQFDNEWMATTLDADSVVVMQVYNHYTLVTDHRINPETGGVEYRVADSYREHWAEGSVNYPLTNEWVSDADLRHTFEQNNQWVTVIRNNEPGE